MSSRSRRLVGKRSLTALFATAVAGALLTTSPTAVAVSTSRPAPAGGTDKAQAVLQVAKSLFDGKPSQLPPGQDATMVLRDLAMARSSLTPAERLEADRLLARPTDKLADPRGSGYQPGTTPKTHCTATACFHWVETSSDAVSPADNNGISDGDGVPDYVEAAEQTVTHVQQTYLAAGYRQVESDGTLGGNALPDIYLANLGVDGLYGYCSSDDTVPQGGPYDVFAFCVYDNDYSPSEFPTNTPLENLQVTAAHEYFHAVQFAYDYFEDSWLMEATATWAEDEVYTDVNDNLQYLSTGPLSRPALPLDTFNNEGYQYGAWIFFRYLTEHFTDAQGGLPTLVRNIWEQADGSSGGPDQYSMQAVATVLKQRGSSLTKAFAGFADANLRPAATYSEGAANSYPSAPLGKFTKASNGWYATKMNHMTSSSARVVPTAKSKNLKVTLNMPPKSSGSAAVVTVNFKDGTANTSMFSLSRKGDGSHSYPFGKSSVQSIEVTLVNAGAKYACWQQSGPFYSCQGHSKNDGQTSKLKMTWS